MEEHSAREPLLSNGGVDHAHVKKTPLVVSWVKWILKIVMWVVFIAWAGLIFLYPAESVYNLYDKWIELTSTNVFGKTGNEFLVFTAPILVIAFLSIALLIVSGEEELQENKSPKRPRFRLRTFPVLVDGPFGIVSAAELIGILLFVVFVIWAVSAYTIQSLKIAANEESYILLKMMAFRFGTIGLFCFAFLFFPITRGSVLLRLINIPYGHATKYHVWLGNLTMFIFTLHGLFYIIAWAMHGVLLQEILQWQDNGVANLAGVIGLSVGLLMWMTSLFPVRKQYFELFFYTHQLYMVLVIFLALHVGASNFTVAAGGIFLFMLDRFLRFCQSRRTVDIISTTSLPCGAVELVLSKPANLRYNALSFIFLRVQELSWLQWHPFSVSSSPLDGKYHLSVIIKVIGEWTAKLRGQISEEETFNKLPFLPRSHFKITASVEGPYGHDSPYHLMYENLILVAGGIGISPFLAILSDILHRIKERKPCLPRKILVVWAIKRSNELTLLSAIDMESIYPFSSDKLNLEICTYVTRESEPPLLLQEEGKVHKTLNSSVFPVSKGCSMSVLVGTGNNIWYGIYVISSTVGFVIFMTLLDIYYINPFSITAWWYKGLLFVACMVASVFIFGGLVVGLWQLWERQISASDQKEHEDDMERIDMLQHNEDSCLENLATSNTIHYGHRPDFEDIFGSISERWGHVDVGVIVCGPPTLQSSVAKECRSQNLKRRSRHPIFHFNSHSFDF